MTLNPVVNDTRGRGYCGPTAVAAVTGQPLSLVLDAFRQAIHGPGWIDRDRAPTIRGSYTADVVNALGLLGYRARFVRVLGKPTLAGWLRSRSSEARQGVQIVEVTGHWVAVSGRSFVDTQTNGQVVTIRNAPGRRKRVKGYIAVERPQGRPAARVTRRPVRPRPLTDPALRAFLRKQGWRCRIERDGDLRDAIATRPDGIEVSTLYHDDDETLERFQSFVMGAATDYLEIDVCEDTGNIHLSA